MIDSPDRSFSIRRRSHSKIFMKHLRKVTRTSETHRHSDFCLTVWRTEMPHRAVQSCGAENFIAEKKSPQKRLQSVSESLQLFVSIGFVPIVVCSTMPNRTCVEWKTGVSIGYRFLYHYSNAIIYYHLDMNSFITDWHS